MPCQSLVPPACRSLFSCSPHLPIWAGAVVLIWHAALTWKAFSLDSSAVLQPLLPPHHHHHPTTCTSQLLIGLSLVLTFSQRGPDEEIRIPYIWIRVPHVLLIRKPIHKPVCLIPYSELWLNGETSKPGTWQLTPTCMFSSAWNMR